jgi:UDP-N-acetylglucosamine:LPS N-acetylglucosamine transferase
MVTDAEAVEKLMKTACELMADTEQIAAIEKNVAKLALADAAMTIADEIYKTIKP